MTKDLLRNAVRQLKIVSLDHRLVKVHFGLVKSGTVVTKPLQEGRAYMYIACATVDTDP